LGGLLRTNIDIDDRLMHAVMQKLGASTKKATVEAALRLLLDVHSQADVWQLHGKIQWKGSLEESRAGRNVF
jgi:Arc/MetJ family transcription regulator